MRLDPITLGSVASNVSFAQQSEHSFTSSKITSVAGSIYQLQQPITVMSDDHSKLAPLLPISNRTVKRLRANDSVHPHVKVGHRQTPYKQNAPPKNGAFCFYSSPSKGWVVFAYAKMPLEQQALFLINTAVP